MKIPITSIVLNGATGEYREVVARVTAETEQEAVNKLFTLARRDDYYYRFIGRSGVIVPDEGGTPVTYDGMTYYACEEG